MHSASLPTLAVPYPSSVYLSASYSTYLWGEWSVCEKILYMVYWYACSTLSLVDISRRDLVDKDRNQNYVNFVHLNLCIALAIGLLIFMAGIQGGAGSTVSFNWSVCMAIIQCSELYHAILMSSHAITTREHMHVFASLKYVLVSIWYAMYVRSNNHVIQHIFHCTL